MMALCESQRMSDFNAQNQTLFSSESYSSDEGNKVDVGYSRFGTNKLLHFGHFECILGAWIIGPNEDACVRCIQEDLGKHQGPEYGRWHCAVAAQDAETVDVLGHCGDQEEQLEHS